MYISKQTQCLVFIPDDARRRKITAPMRRFRSTVGDAGNLCSTPHASPEHISTSAAPPPPGSLLLGRSFCHLPATKKKKNLLLLALLMQTWELLLAITCNKAALCKNIYGWFCGFTWAWKPHKILRLEMEDTLWFLMLRWPRLLDSSEMWGWILRLLQKAPQYSIFRPAATKKKKLKYHVSTSHFAKVSPHFFKQRFLVMQCRNKKTKVRRATFAEATCTPPSSSSPASSPQILILAPINQRGRREKFSPRISKKSISSLLSWWWRHAACSTPPEKKNNTQGGGRGGKEGDATPTFSRSPSGARLWKQFPAHHAWIKVDKLVSWCARLFLVTSN